MIYTHIYVHSMHNTRLIEYMIHNDYYNTLYIRLENVCEKVQQI